MKDLRGKAIWLVGASEGLGRALARHLHGAGAHLVVSARNQARLDGLARELPGVQVAALDVLDRGAVERVAQEHGPFDMMIYNAGAYDPMAAQDWDTDGILRMSAVNYTGAVHVIGAVIAGFLQRGAGEIILIGSLAGYRGLPAALGYGPGKAALRSMAETLRYDVRDTGVWVKLVNPGFIRTRLTDKNQFKMPMLMEPDTAAAHVMRAIGKRRFRTDFPVPFSWVIRAIGMLPDWVIWRGK